MKVKEPLLYKEQVESLSQSIHEKLTGSGWQSQKDGAGSALVQLFGRLAQVIIHRLNQAPRQHFRTFLNEAGIDQMTPRAAKAELTFTPTPDGPAVIQAPAGVQVATRPSETQPEVIFETDQAISVIPAQLVQCIVIDPLNQSDRTAAANGQVSGAFAAFQGDSERERILYLGDEKLFTFADDASRQHATITIHFTFFKPGNPEDEKWRVQWLYWDGAQWVDLDLFYLPVSFVNDFDASKVSEELRQKFSDNGKRLSEKAQLTVQDPGNKWVIDDTNASYLMHREDQKLTVCLNRVQDNTQDFRHDGDVHLRQLPKLSAIKLNQTTNVWLAARLTGGVKRERLPMVRTITLQRTINLPVDQAVPAAINTALAATQSGTLFTPLDLKAGFFPLGAYPVESDAFYLQVDEAFAKAGADITVTLALEETAAKIAAIAEEQKPRIAWEYFSNKGWTLLGQSWRGCPALTKRNFAATQALGFSKPTLRTQPFTRSKVLEFEIPLTYYDKELPPAFVDGTVITDIYSQRRYVQIPIPAACTQLPPADLIDGAYQAADEKNTLGFSDNTCALTSSGVLQFTIPAKNHERIPAFAKTEINGQGGYWLRARLIAGSYSVPQPAPEGLLNYLRGLIAQPWLPPQSVPPVIKQIDVTYGDYAIIEPDQPKSPEFCQSKTDARWRDHALDLKDGKSFQPFSAVVETRALYLGFQPLDAKSPGPAFPAGQWIQIRIAVAEAKSLLGQAQVEWAYWNGNHWHVLQTRDDTLGLQRSGYVGFYAPADHQPSDEFAEHAYWLRLRPLTAGMAPRLQTIRLNTVLATNAITITDEIIGSSNGEPDQQFSLARSPLLPDEFQLEVFEPDQRSETVDAAPIADASTGGQPAAPQEARSDGAWMPWTPVATLYGCQADSRVYLLDPIKGAILFGDGKRGKIPPPERDNIRAKRYRTHNAAVGNLAPNTITVLRNPSGDLGTVRSVTNLMAAAGGTAVESVEEVEERGPYRLKNRQRAVTVEDFEWVAREVEGVARARCLPTRDAQGQTKPGWVTVVVTPQAPHVIPENAETRPTPTLELLQQVHTHLQALALANLKDLASVTAVEANQESLANKARTPDPKRLSSKDLTADEDRILVKGPAYLEVSVRAKVVANKPEQADQVRHAIVQRLKDFLHPTKGGPEGKGWESGRDVYRSEVAAVIEHVAGVDHVAQLDLRGSSQQQRSLQVRGSPLPWALSAGSQVSSFDEQIKLALAEPVAEGATSTEIAVYGFAVGDEVTVVASDNSPATDMMLSPPLLQRVAQVSEGGFAALFAEPFEFAKVEEFEAWQKLDLRLVSNDQRWQIPVQPSLTSHAKTGMTRLSGVIAPFPMDRLSTGTVVNIVAENTSAPHSRQWREVYLTGNGFKLIFDKVIEFKAPEFEGWQRSQPALLSDDGHVRLPIRPLYKRCQPDKVFVFGVTVQITVAALNAGGGVSVVAAGGGSPGVAPLQAKRQVAHLSNCDLTLLFEQPWRFADGKQFADWQATVPALISGDQHIRLPIQCYDLPSVSGELRLLGVALRSFVRHDQISLTHHDQRSRRVDFWPIDKVTISTNFERIFVPADYLVCSGNHLIEMSLEAANVDSPAQPG